MADASEHPTSWQWAPPGRTVTAGLVHHYTDARGLIGLIEDRALWATEATGLNDLAEVKQGWEFIEERLKNIHSAHSDEIRRLAQDGRDFGGAAPSSVFVLCASLSDDDAAQWRSYGDGGRGYVASLSADAPLAVCGQGEKPEPGNYTKLSDYFANAAQLSGWTRVLYDDAEKMECLAHLVRWADSLLDEAYEREADGGFDPDGSDWDEVRGSILNALSAFANLVKSSGFSGENEARRVVSFLFPGRHLRYRPARYGLTSYCRIIRPPTPRPAPIEWVAPETLPLERVRTGPLLDSGSQRATLERLLRAHGLRDVDVEESMVPLR